MFRIQGHRLPMAGSYKDAVALFEKSKPFSKDNPNTRALCTKHETDKSIRREGDVIFFQYFRTDLVRWYSPCHVCVEYHDSISSRTFIDQFLPPGMRAQSVRGETYVNGVCPKQNQVLFQYDPATNKWVPDADMVRKDYEFRVNRKRANEIKKLFKPFLEWKEATEKLRGEVLGANVPVPVSGARSVLTPCLDAMAVPEEHYVHMANALPARLNLLRAANNLGGAVERIELPIGQIPRRPSAAYDRFFFRDHL